MPRAAMPYYTPGFDMKLPLVHGSRVSCLDCKPSLPAPLPAMDPIVSDTGELRWQTDDGKDGLVTLTTPPRPAPAGFVIANEKGHPRHLHRDIAHPIAPTPLSPLPPQPPHPNR